MHCCLAFAANSLCSLNFLPDIDVCVDQYIFDDISSEGFFNPITSFYHIMWKLCRFSGNCSRCIITWSSSRSLDSFSVLTNEMLLTDILFQDCLICKQSQSNRSSIISMHCSVSVMYLWCIKRIQYTFGDYFLEHVISSHLRLIVWGTQLLLQLFSNILLGLCGLQAWLYL